MGAALPDHGFDDPKNQPTNCLATRVELWNCVPAMDQTNCSASDLANQTKLPGSSLEVLRPNDVIAWAKQVLSKNKLDFGIGPERDECAAKFCNSSLDEAAQTLQSDS